MTQSHFFVHVYIVILFGVHTSAFINPSGTEPTVTKGCRPQVDVIFLLDGSDSISDTEFLQQKQFLRRFVELSDIGPESVRVGLAVVSSKIGDELPLSLNATKASFLVALNDISQPQEGSRTDLGLIEMEQLFSTNSRRGVARIGVIITDGRAKYVRATEGESRVVKDAGIFLIAVGVGRLINFPELEKIASTKSNAYKLEPLDLSTRYLAETVDFLGLESCTGNMMIDKLGILSNKNSAVVSGSPNAIPKIAEPSNTLPKNVIDLPAGGLDNMAAPTAALANTIDHLSVSLPNNLMDMPSADIYNIVSQSSGLTNNMMSPSNALPKNVMDLPSGGLNNMAAPTAALANKIGSLPNNLKDLPSTDIYNLMSRSSGLTNNMMSPSIALPNNILDMLPSEQNNLFDPSIVINSNNVAEPPATGSNVVPLFAGASSNNMADSQGSLFSDIANQPGPLFNNLGNQPGSLLGNMADQQGLFLGNVANKPGSLLSNKVNQPSPLLSNIAIQPGSLLGNMADHPGSLLGNLADQPGSLLGNMAEQSGSLLGNMADQSGSLLGNMADKPGSLQSYMAAQPGSLLSNMADQPSSLLSKMVNQPSSLLSKMGEPVGQNVIQPIPPVPKPQPPTYSVLHNQAKSNQATFEENNVSIKNNNMPKIRNFLGLKMSPFGSMGRFSAINAINPGFQSQLTNHPTAPSTEAPVVITTHAPIITTPTTTQPIATAPQFVAQTAELSNLRHNSLVQYHNNGSSPTETANLMIQNLMGGTDMLRNKGSSLGEEPQLFANPGMYNSGGVSLQNPGASVGDSLAFLKAETKHVKTIKEISNPIYQMFEVSRSTASPIKDMAVQTITTKPVAQTNQQSDVALLQAQCSNRHFVNGVAHISTAGSCTEFVKCYQENGVISFKEVKCPFETIFDDQQFVCRHYAEQRCYNDPCADQRLTSYSHTGNCRAYWQCTIGVSAPMCCPRGTSYVQGYGCVRNATCSDTCMDFGDLRTVTMATKCQMLAIEGDTRGYFENVAGVGWVVRQCAPGTNFEQAHCECSSALKIAAEICEPELYLDFQGGIVDKSKNSLSMGIQNVKLDGGAGAFYGQSHLKLWRFSGMSLGQQVTISFRFRTSVTAKKGKLMHIVSNCCYGCSGKPKPSLDIALIPASNGGVAVFSITSAEAGEMFMFLPFRDTFTGWNKLDFTYDGLVMTGTVNGQTASKKMLGNIEAKSDPLLIGSCGVQNAYDGFLDEFKFYMCNP